MNPFRPKRKATYTCAHCLRDLGEYSVCISCNLRLDRERELRQLHREVFVATIAAHSNISLAIKTADASMRHWSSVERDREATIAHVLEPAR